jgi:hypothetical protein
MKWYFEYGAEDNFIVALDSYGDKRNAYLLVINPNGAQYDALVVDNNRRANAAWNGVWYAADEQVWGINFERNIRRKREQALRQGWSRDAAILQVNRAGALTGLRDLTRMKIFEFRPHVLGGAEKSRNVPATNVTGLGLDFNYLFNPTVKLDFTIHPDFAQIESDDLIVNLTRFSVSIPEKRQFFLEAQNFFDFPLGKARPFYSRRVGYGTGLETEPLLRPGSELQALRHPPPGRRIGHRRDRLTDEFFGDAEALWHDLRPMEQRRKQDSLQFPFHLDPQTGSVALFRAQSIRRHFRPAPQLAAEQDHGHDQIRLVFRDEVMGSEKGTAIHTPFIRPGIAY